MSITGSIAARENGNIVLCRIAQNAGENWVPVDRMWYHAHYLVAQITSETPVSLIKLYYLPEIHYGSLNTMLAHDETIS